MRDQVLGNLQPINCLKYSPPVDNANTHNTHLQTGHIDIKQTVENALLCHLFQSLHAVCLKQH
jgi:hypothetical protein